MKVSIKHKKLFICRGNYHDKRNQANKSDSRDEHPFSIKLISMMTFDFHSTAINDYRNT